MKLEIMHDYLKQKVAESARGAHPELRIRILWLTGSAFCDWPDPHFVINRIRILWLTGSDFCDWPDPYFVIDRIRIFDGPDPHFVIDRIRIFCLTGSEFCDWPELDQTLKKEKNMDPDPIRQNTALIMFSQYLRILLSKKVSINRYS